jgi:hypothetical protein
VAVVVSVDGDDAAQDQEVRDRATETGPESVPRSRFGVRSGVSEEPMSRVRPEDDHDNDDTDDDEQRSNSKSSFHGFTPDLCPGLL